MEDIKTENNVYDTINLIESDLEKAYEQILRK